VGFRGGSSSGMMVGASNTEDLPRCACSSLRRRLTPIRPPSSRPSSGSVDACRHITSLQSHSAASSHLFSALSPIAAI
jgi:hypothetical protein